MVLVIGIFLSLDLRRVKALFRVDGTREAYSVDQVLQVGWMVVVIFRSSFYTRCELVVLRILC